MAISEPSAPAAPPPSSAAGRKKLLVAVLVAVLLVGAFGATAIVLLSTPPVAPSLDRVEVTATKTTVEQREEIRVTAAAFDTAGADLTGSTNFAWTADPANSVQFVGSGNEVNVIALRAASVALTATATLEGASKEGSVSLTITALAFVVTASDSTPMVGNPITLTVQVMRPDSTTAATYRGTVAFDSDDPAADLPPNYPFAVDDEGRKDFPVTVRKAGQVRITVSDTLAAITGSVTVTAERPAGAPTASFTVSRSRMHVDVDASDSTDPEGSIATYAWDWGDGTTTAPSASWTADHDYATPGAYTIILTVTDAASESDIATRIVSVNTSTLDAELWDFFNVPFGEFWDYRGPLYGDQPFEATCFSRDAIPGGTGSPNPSGTGICDVAPTGYSGETWMTYPYMDWYPWYFDEKSTFVYAPYRLRMDGVDQPGSTLAQPVILPVLNSAQAAGASLHVVWDGNYITTTRADEIDQVCFSLLANTNDGFIWENTIRITLDLAESRRIFGVVATNPTEAAAWWANSANMDPDCATERGVETRWEAFMAEQGSKSGLTSGTGPYDLSSGYEWWYVPFLTNFESATVNPTTGETAVLIKHWAWGTEALLGRWFYWGSAKYFDAGPDAIPGNSDDIPNAEVYPHAKAGWWPWEFVWFEQVHFDTAIGASSQSFTFETVVQYHLQAAATTGLDGIYHTGTVASTDDGPVWLFQPVLADYIYGGTADSLSQHVISELDPYAGPDGRPGTEDDDRYLHTSPGSVYYGTDFMFDYMPAEWDLDTGDTVTVRMPTGTVKFVDPYSPLTANAADIRRLDGRIAFLASIPEPPVRNWELSDANLDGLQETVALFGPIDWGGPARPFVSAPLLEFAPATPIGTALSVASAVESGRAASTASFERIPMAIHPKEVLALREIASGPDSSGSNPPIVVVDAAPAAIVRGLTRELQTGYRRPT